MANAEYCFICQKKYESNDLTSEVLSEGMVTFRKISAERNDAYTDYLNETGSITVHRDCRRKYCLKRNNGSLRYPDLTKPSSTSNNQVFSPPAKRLRKSSEFPSFEFSKDCFLCGEEAKKKLDSRRKATEVYVVTTLEVKETIMKRLREVNSEQTKAVITRINTIDLISVNARYHNKCRATLFSNAKSSSMGRPMDTAIDKGMEKIYEYIDAKRKNNNKQAFILTDLQKLLGNNYRANNCSIK